MGKIVNVCVNVLEFCKLRTQDKDSKQKLGNMVKEISEGKLHKGLSNQAEDISKELASK